MAILSFLILIHPAHRDRQHLFNHPSQLCRTITNSFGRRLLVLSCSVLGLNATLCSSTSLAAIPLKAFLVRLSATKFFRETVNVRFVVIPCIRVLIYLFLIYLFLIHLFLAFQFPSLVSLDRLIISLITYLDDRRSLLSCYRLRRNPSRNARKSRFLFL